MGHAIGYPVVSSNMAGKPSIKWRLRSLGKSLFYFSWGGFETASAISMRYRDYGTYGVTQSLNLSQSVERIGWYYFHHPTSYHPIRSMFWPPPRWTIFSFCVAGRWDMDRNLEGSQLRIALQREEVWLCHSICQCLTNFGGWASNIEISSPKRDGNCSPHWEDQKNTLENQSLVVSIHPEKIVHLVHPK